MMMSIPTVSAIMIAVITISVFSMSSSFIPTNVIPAPVVSVVIGISIIAAITMDIVMTITFTGVLIFSFHYDKLLSEFVLCRCECVFYPPPPLSLSLFLSVFPFFTCMHASLHAAC